MRFVRYSINSVKYFIFTALDIIKQTFCRLSIHGIIDLHYWRYYEIPTTWEISKGNKIKLDFIHRECELCGKKMYRDKLPPAFMEWEHWHDGEVI